MHYKDCRLNKLYHNGSHTAPRGVRGVRAYGAYGRMPAPRHLSQISLAERAGFESGLLAHDLDTDVNISFVSTVPRPAGEVLRVQYSRRH